MSDSVNSSESPPSYSELVDSILSELELFLSAQINELFDKTDDFLFNAADNASSIDEQNRMFEFMNELRVEKISIEEVFVNEFNAYLKPISISKELPSKKRQDNSNSLGLIDQDEMDEMVAITTISGKATTNYQEAISHIEARLEHLGLQTKNIFLPKALEPINFCHAFQESLNSTEFTIRNKLVLYKMFGQEVSTQLFELYTSLNNLMIDAGVLPQIELSGEIKKSAEAEAPMSGSEDIVDEASDEASTEENPQSYGIGGRGGYTSRMTGGAVGVGRAGGGMSGGGNMGDAGTAAASGNMSGGGASMGSGSAGGSMGGAQMTGNMSDNGGMSSSGSGGMGGGNMSNNAGMGGGGSSSIGGGNMPGNGGTGGGSGGMSGSGGAGSAGGGADGSSASSGSGTSGSGESMAAGNNEFSAGYSLSEAQQSIEEFVGGTPSNRETAGASGGGGGYYTHNDMVSALTSMQSSARVDHQAALEFNASAIKKAVLTTIGEKDGGAVTKRVNQVSEKTIDFIKLIFDAIIEDKSINDTIKTLLLSLQIPVIKAAMIDPDFFVDDQHPARLLLDKVAEAGVGVSDHEDEIYKSLETIVSKLLNDYDEDVSAFTDAYDNLCSVTEEIYNNARQREEESKKQVKYAHARNIVLQEIRKVTYGKELPTNIRRFVLKVWPSLMFNHYLKNGKANDEWVEMMMILAKVIETVQPLSSQEDQDELGLSHEDIINAVEDKLSKAKKSQSLIDEVAAGLISTYKDLLKIQNLPEQAELEKEAEKLEQEAPVDDENETPSSDAVEVKDAGKDSQLTDSAEDKLNDTDVAELSNDEGGSGLEVENSIEGEAEVSANEKTANPQKALENLPNDVQPGSWFIVFNGDDKPVRRLKLAVILTQDATLVFVDHLGNVVIEKNAIEFTDELGRGVSGVIMQHSVFDHALRTALNTIKK